MNSFYTSSFISPLHSESHAISACSYGSLPNRYDGANTGQAYTFPQGVASIPSGYGCMTPGQYAGSPVAGTCSENSPVQPPLNLSSCARQDGNVHDLQGFPIKSWGAVNPEQRSAYNQAVTEASMLNNCSPLSNNGYSSSAPFYPWMGIVGKYVKNI